MYNYDPEELMKWSGDFGMKYEYNQEKGDEIYTRIMQGDTRTAFLWPNYIDVAILIISVN